MIILVEDFTGKNLFGNFIFISVRLCQKMSLNSFRLIFYGKI